jgi:hypothetical protein
MARGVTAGDSASTMTGCSVAGAYYAPRRGDGNASVLVRGFLIGGPFRQVVLEDGLNLLGLEVRLVMLGAVDAPLELVSIVVVYVAVMHVLLLRCVHKGRGPNA